MELYETFEEFIEYIQNNGKDWVEAGLIPDAPEEAKNAYKVWVKYEKERIAKGVN